MKILVALFIFISPMAYAQSILISRDNKMGVLMVDRLTKDGKGFSFNHVKVPRSKNQLAQAAFERLLKMSPSKEQCFAGHFVLTIEDKAVKKEIRGCAEGDEYGKLIAALYKLK